MSSVQEEMARLQQNIEELKAASGQDTEEEKVGAQSVQHIWCLSFEIKHKAFILLLLLSGEEPADRQTVQHGPREAPEDPSAHGNFFTRDGTGVVCVWTRQQIHPDHMRDTQKQHS